MSSHNKVAFDESEEFDEEVDFEEEDSEEEEADMNFDELEAMDETLASYLMTEDGDNVATALMNVSDNMAAINKTLEMQNKILVKILTQLSKSQKSD